MLGLICDSGAICLGLSFLVFCFLFLSFLALFLSFFVIFLSFLSFLSFAAAQVEEETENMIGNDLPPVMIMTILNT